MPDKDFRDLQSGYEYRRCFMPYDELAKDIMEQLMQQYENSFVPYDYGSSILLPGRMLPFLFWQLRICTPTNLAKPILIAVSYKYVSFLELFRFW